MHTISNEFLQIEITNKGAELQSILHKKTGLEYLWNADPNFWSKKSPVLFPIVGGLKNGSYQFNNMTYHLGRHGFARDRIFEVYHQSNDSITYVLKSNEETLAVYPFEFNFFVTYHLSGNQLTCTYKVENTGNQIMYFSCGAHPAFKVPLTNDTVFEDWQLQFSSIENTPKYPLSSDGLIEEKPIACLENTNILPLTKELFYTDALVFKKLQSNKISIVTNKSEHGLTMQFDGFPYFGIWSFKNATFVCLEPWCGIADGVKTTSKLDDKEGIYQLDINANWQRSWSVVLF